MTECNQCGNTMGTMHQVFEGHYICDHCYDSWTRASILSHDVKPVAEFYGEGNFYYGLEVEMMDGSQPYQMAGYLNYLLPEIYTKRDGSVPGGFELVTHPCSKDYHESMDYDHIFALCEKEGYKSHDASCSCGLHIHVSRAPLSPRAIGAQLYLIHKFWDKYVKFSRRKSGDVNMWAGKYDNISFPSVNTFDQIYTLARTENGRSRYKCINLQNTSTIEYRIFRGTLKRDTLIASIQFIDTLVHLSLTLSEEEIRNLSWDDLKVHFSKKKELKAYLEKRGL